MPLVRLFATLRRTTGLTQISLEGDTVAAVLNALCRQFPDLETVLFEAGGLRPHYIVMVNGLNITLKQGLATSVGPEDQVAVFPPIAGG
jgi:molybdopterin synthase sulfur carrier subunit